MLSRRIALVWLALVFVAATANAGWKEVSSDHFVIYSKQDADLVKHYADRLERLHAAMAHLYAKQQVKPSPSNRVAVYVVADTAEVVAITGLERIGGAYSPGAGSSMAVIPPLATEVRVISSGGEPPRIADDMLFHEYAHHFMYSLTASALPRWFKEGFAEFFAGVQFRRDGSVAVGTPGRDRIFQMKHAPRVPIRVLLEFDGGYQERTGYNSFYAQSWLLFHYLQMAPERAGQRNKYEALMMTGTSPLEAAEQAFGNLEKLGEDVEAYAARPKLSAMVIDAQAIDIGPIALRLLRPGEQAMLPTMIESKWGVSREEALKLLPGARRVAARYPNDAAVLTALAEAECDAGFDDAALAAADAALALDPKQVNAFIQKGRALESKIESGSLPGTAWSDVRAELIKANALENDHPLPLIRFYRSYLKEGIPPTKNAIAGLEWALQLAPFDPEARRLVAEQMIADERFKEAAGVLAPLAYSPHESEYTDAARKLLKEVEARLTAGSELRH